MKISCNKNVLLEGINIVQKAVSPKSTMPILEGILLEASDNLKLIGNDLDLGIECIVSAFIEEEGSVVLNAKIFGEIIRRLPNDIVYIQVLDNYKTNIKCGNTEFNIMGISPIEFPELPKVQKGNTLDITQKQLRSMIRETIFAVGTNENKLILTGSCVELDGNEINMVSVDGYRLALRKEALDSDYEKQSIVIPGKTLNELSKVIKEEEEKVSLHISPKHVMFEFDNCRIVSRLLEGEFLNYKQIIPKEYQLRVKVKVKPMIEAIERCALIILSDNQKHPIKMGIGTDIINISCKTQTGTVYDSVEAETYGNDLEIGFNYRYLLDALKACECEEVYMEFNTSLSPCIIKPIEGDKFTHLVLPVRF